MKKISLLLALLTCATATHNSFSKYDIKKEVRKFRKKHGSPKIDPANKGNNYGEENYAKEKNEILNLIEKYGSNAINMDQIPGLEREGGSFTDNPLTLAIGAEDKPFIKFLLQHGVDPNKAISYSFYTREG